MAIAPVSTDAPDVDPATLPSFPYRVYILVLLLSISAISAIDRQILDILIEPIREEFGLSDGQMGALNGLAFAGVFALSAIPLARVADRFERKTVLAICVVFWSAATALSSVARSYVQLFIARMGVGLGEAGLSPTGPALIADIFPRKQRGTVTSLYMLGPPIGIGLAYAVGGWVLQHYSWREAFLIAGIPGFILGPLAYFTIRNIRKGASDGVTRDLPQPPLGKTIKAIFGIKTLTFMVLALAMQSIITSGVQRWVPAFLQRTQDIEPAVFGAALGSAVATGNFIGHLAGGPLADLVGRRDPRYQFGIALIATIGGAIVTWFLFTTDDINLFYILAGFQAGFAGLFAAPLIMICTTLPPVWARATTAAVALMSVYLIGFGISPAIIGAVSDLMVPFYGEEDSLRMAVLWLLLLAIPACLLFLVAARYYRDDLAESARQLAEDTAD